MRATYLVYSEFEISGFGVIGKGKNGIVVNDVSRRPIVVALE
jgi:hypothetical protein